MRRGIWKVVCPWALVVAAGCGSRSALDDVGASLGGSGGGGSGGDGGAGTGGAGALGIQLTPQLAVATGNDPTDVHVADFDGDGHLDVAVVNRGSDSVGIYLGEGDGTLGGATTFKTGVAPILFTVADMNQDGSPDVVTADGSTLSVLLGGGDGELQLPLSFTGCGLPLAIASADVNGDGWPDVAAWCAQDATTHVLAGAGDGTLTPLTAFPFNSSLGIALGDVNGDGARDLAQSGPGQAISISLNQGNGTFEDPGELQVDGIPYPLALVDVSSDQHLDVVTGLSPAGSMSLNVLLGAGDGSFAPALGALPTDGAFSAQFMDTGDLDGDGHLDVATSNTAGDIRIVLGRGDGAFGPPQLFAVTTWVSGIAIADMNGDGRGDLVVLIGPGVGEGNSSPGTVQVLLNTTP